MRQNWATDQEAPSRLAFDNCVAGKEMVPWEAFKDVVKILFIIIYLLNFNPLPPPRSRHASCQEMSYSKREAKLKKEKKKDRKFPFYAL